MKRVIRKCTFETNSSTSHSCVIMMKEQYDRWCEDKLYYLLYEPYWNDKLPEDEKAIHGRLYTEDEVLDFYKKAGYEYIYDESEDISDEELKVQYIREHYGFVSYEMWNDEYLEKDEHYFTTPGGEDIVVLCKYGANY